MTPSRPCPRLLHALGILPLPVVERRGEHQLVEADDAVHRGADLVAHRRQELRLGAGCGEGVVAGDGEGGQRPVLGQEHPHGAHEHQRHQQQHPEGRLHHADRAAQQVVEEQQQRRHRERQHGECERTRGGPGVLLLGRHLELVAGPPPGHGCHERGADHPGDVEPAHQPLGGGHEEADVGEQPAGHADRERDAERRPPRGHHEGAGDERDQDGVDHWVAGEHGAVAHRDRAVLEDVVHRRRPEQQHADHHDGERVDHRLDVDLRAVVVITHHHHEHTGAEADVAEVVEDVGHRHVGRRPAQVVGLVDHLRHEGGHQAGGHEGRDEPVSGCRAAGTPPRHRGGRRHDGQVGERAGDAGRHQQVGRGEHRGAQPERENRAGEPGGGQGDLLRRRGEVPA